MTSRSSIVTGDAQYVLTTPFQNNLVHPYVSSRIQSVIHARISFMGISAMTYDKRKAKCRGLEVSVVKRLKELELENARLTQMCADLSLKTQELKEILTKTSDADDAD